MLIEVFCKKGCERWFMKDLSTPKECPTCKSHDIWWANDEENCQAVEYTGVEGDEDE